MVNLKKLLVVATAFFGCTLSAPTTDEAGAVIPEAYIVTFKSNVKAAEVKTHIKWVKGIHSKSLDKRGTKGVERTYEGTSGFQGYAGTFDDSTIKKIKKSDDVAAVEADRVWTLQWHTGPKKQPLDAEDKDILPRNLKGRIDRREIHEREVRERSSSKKRRVVKRVAATQTGSTWGLGTVSHRAMNYFTYLYDSLAGTQTWAYVVDTGVRTTHTEFEGRATLVWTGFPGVYNDTSGHGTHVSGTIAGKTYGVSKKTNILGVKIFNGEDTTTSIVLAGYQWAVNDIINKRRNEWAVINMSIQGPYSQAFNNAIEAAWTNNKVVSVVAAGNYGVNANTMSPSSSPSAITVGAIDSTWTMPSWSNWGSTVDILAPGVGVKSAWNTNDTAANTIDGTSMACPHVAGLVLYAYTVPGIWAVDLPAYLKKVATPNKAGNLRGSPNLVANNANKQQPAN